MPSLPTPPPCQRACDVLLALRAACPFASITANELSLASAEMFFLEVVPVSPTCFRSPAKMGDMLFEHPQNEYDGTPVSVSLARLHIHKFIGHRVSYATRSVISPDLNIEPSEIGIPPVLHASSLPRSPSRL
ncbi:hypothetical protein FOMPIDRAFT_82368 [Fomitopsis schrenkii]|uniref:Uncharacterized protein n=1 Tax=Fomitopsis schrenkii TaxID=2126942 RepID=S8DXL9_FOMSC|nr:hypothetical protein FOMPIDRAFT_82368 [Fomitopsis schrenkii]